MIKYLAVVPVVLLSLTVVNDVVAASTEERIARLERVIKAQQQSGLELLQRVDALQQDVSNLRGLNEQQSYLIEQMTQRQRQLYDDIAKLSAKPAVTTVSSSNVGNSSLGETASYEQAVNLVLQQRKYEQAIPAFKQFIAQYPNSTYTANANYWLGQLLFNKGDLTGAKKAFSTVVNQFKASNKHADSLVKLGMVAIKEGDVVTAKQYYQQVITHYSDSAAATIAKQELAKL